MRSNYRLKESDAITFANLVLETKTEDELSKLIRSSIEAVYNCYDIDFNFFKTLNENLLTLNRKISVHEIGDLDFWLGSLGFEFEFGKKANNNNEKLIEDCINHIYNINKKILYVYAVDPNGQSTVVSEVGARILYNNKGKLFQLMEQMYSENLFTIYGLNILVQSADSYQALINYTLVKGFTSKDYKNKYSNQLLDTIVGAFKLIFDSVYSEELKFVLDSLITASGSDMYLNIVTANTGGKFRYLDFRKLNINKIKGSVRDLKAFKDLNANPYLVDMFFDKETSEKYLASLTSILDVNCKFHIESVKFLNKNNISMDNFPKDIISKRDLRMGVDWHPFTNEHKKFFANRYDIVLNEFCIGNTINKILRNPKFFDFDKNSEEQIDEMSKLSEYYTFNVTTDIISEKVTKLLLKKFKLSKDSIKKLGIFKNFIIKA